MAVAVKDAIYRGRIRTVEEAIDAWHCCDEDVGQMFEIVLRESISALDALGELEKESWLLLRRGKITRALEHGRRLGNGIELGTRMVRRAADCVRDVESMGYTVDSAVEFGKYVKKPQKGRDGQSYCRK